MKAGEYKIIDLYRFKCVHNTLVKLLGEKKVFEISPIQENIARVRKYKP